jgi:outer membrane protein assembly factor BamB
MKIFCDARCTIPVAVRHLGRLASIFLAAGAGLPLSAPAADWTQFRGPSFGLAPAAELPTSWNEPANKNIAWKADLPGRGPSSPIVVGDRVVVTASEGANQERLLVLCFDERTGNLLWQRQFWATGRTATHPDSANAAPTPASDGERIFAFFSSNDLICLSLDGDLVWYRGLAFDHPKAGNDIGMASSPVVIQDTVIVQVENQGDSFAAGLDAATGETRWQVAREPVANWTSPAAWSSADGERTLVLLQSPSGLTAHDPLTGEQLWSHETSCDAIPSPTLDDRRVVFVASDRLTVLNIDQQGKLQPLWDAARLRPGAASPVVSGERLYVINRVGVLTCADASSGQSLWQLRLQGEFWGTPILAGDRLYVVNKDGEGIVVRVGDDEGEVLGINPMGERVQASPALANGALYIRSDKSLWKIAAE